MSLQSLIANGNYASAQAAYDAITTPSVEIRDEQFYTWNGVAKVAGKENVSGLFNAIKAAGFEAFVIQLGGKGLQLTDSDVRDMLGQFALGGLPGAQELLDQGVSLVAPWQSTGITEPTLEDVQQVFDSVVLANEWSTLQNEVINPASNQRATLIAALRQAADALEA